MVSLVNLHTNATSKWYLWEIAFKFSLIDSSVFQHINSLQERAPRG
jgi:hypothetical protein